MKTPGGRSAPFAARGFQPDMGRGFTRLVLGLLILSAFLLSRPATAADVAIVAIEVERMDCSVCTLVVSTQVMRLTGVVAIDSRPHERRLIVQFEPWLVSYDDILQAITNSGYTVAPGQKPGYRHRL